jgi:hypothetical protein
VALPRDGEGLCVLLQALPTGQLALRTYKESEEEADPPECKGKK